MYKLPYIKMHGCQNDYVYLDNLDGKLAALSSVDLPALARKVSDRKAGIGSDGLIIVEAPQATPKAIARMRMFNADGSEGKMCGNGIRCVAKLLYEKLGPQPSYWIETASGARECFVIDASNPERFIIRVNMGKPSFLPMKIPVQFDDVMVLNEDFDVADKTFQISCVSMGNPHCVIPVTDLDSFPVEKYGPLIEKHEVFPEGVNVEFIETNPAGTQVRQRTWERGSGETLACGSGASAVGVILILSKTYRSPVEVHLKGGKLSIEWDGLRDVWMTGEAVTLSKGEWTL